MLTGCKGTEVSANPFFETWDTPYGVPPFDRIKTEHYMPAYEAAMKEHLAEIEAIVSNSEAPTFENVMLAYDRAGLKLEEVNLVFSMLVSCVTNDEMQKIQAEVMPRLTAHNDEILMNEALFTKIKAVYDQCAALNLDPERARLLDKTYTEFVRAGALLDAAGKEQLRKINGELTSLGVTFGQHVLAENNAFELVIDESQTAGLPEGVRAAAKEKAEAKQLTDKYIITLDAPSRIAFLTYAQDRGLREQVFKGYIERGNRNDANDNKQLVLDIARLRSQKAKLLGHKDWGSYVVSNEMAKTTAAVYDLLDEIWTPALEGAKAEVAEMQPLLNADVPGATFEAWDWWFYADKVRKQKYALDEEALKPYFSLDNTVRGIFELSNRLFGLTFRPVNIPVYHKDCSAYEVLDADNSLIGIIYFDFFPRASKNNGAWCGNYRIQRYDNGERVAPIVSIVCNFTPPTGDKPALFTLEEVETLFHEFGHALHFLLSDVKYRGLTWTEGDFIELPSQVMENWAVSPEMLRLYATHYQTGKVIPDHLVKAIQNSAKFNQGFITTELVAAALIDQDIHSITDFEPFDVNVFERDALNTRRGLIPQIVSRYRYPYFLHIFDGEYSAGYYFYIWAEVLDKDAFRAFKSTGDIFNREVARKFRKEILERGGSADGMTMYRKFRGMDPDKSAMLIGRGLMEEPITLPVGVADVSLGE